MFGGKWEEMDNAFRLILLVVLAFAVLIGIWLGGTFAYNSVRVWNAETRGRAALAEAQQNRQIAVAEALALKESAKLRADAEVIRAQGVARANEIVANGLGGPEGYLRWQYIQTLENSQNQIIYVPTEGGLPVLESGRLIANRPAAPAE